MKRFRRSFKLIVTSLIFVLCVIGLFVFGTLQQTALPDNPLLSDVNASHMLLNTGGNLNISDDVLNSEQSADINKAEKITDNENSTEAETDVTTKPVTQHKKTQQQIIYPRIYEAIYNFPITDTKAQNININNKQSNKNKKVSTDENNVNNNGANINPNLPQENNKPSKDNTDVIYFTTTIKNGETVNSRDYSFEIYHKQSKLTVKSEKIYVNGTEQIQFKGNVLLEEGINVISIIVKYADKDGKIISAYGDYTVYVDLGEIIIFTDLCDQTTETNILTFNASASFDENQLSVKVLCNNKEIVDESGSFTVNLKKGKNTVKISAQIGKHTSNRTFTINCTAPESFSIYTDLSNCIVHSDSLSFTAYILNGSERSRLTVVVNGKNVSGNINYKANLNIGNNIIRLKATDKISGEIQTLNNSFIIKYVPNTTDETAPKLSYINVTDGMSVTGSDFTLDLDPIDYQGNKIYYNGITVHMNGMLYPYKWASEYTSYQLWLENGANTLDIRITDNDGRYSDYIYTINCNAVNDGDKIGEITISIDANVLALGNIIEPVKVPIYQGENGADVITRILEEHGFTYSHSSSLEEGFYLSRISKTGIGVGVSIPQELVNYINEDGLEWKSQKYDDSIGEFDYCQGSGWMYSINNIFTNFGLSDAKFKDGDIVKIRYTLAYGKDIGGFVAAGNVGGKNYATTW